MNSTQVKGCFVGIDVSQGSLDVFVRPTGQSWSLPNEAFDGLCQQLKALEPTLIVLEASGGYEANVLKALLQAGLPVSREQARRLYYHGKGAGQLAKTDRLDAANIAHYGECYAGKIVPMTLACEQQVRLQQLSRRRQELVQMRTAEKNRRQAPALEPALQASCERMLAYLGEEIAHIEAELQELIAQDEPFQRKQALLQTMPGIARQSSTLLMAELPELGQVGRKKIGALAGVVPYKHSSGKFQGQEHIQGGRNAVRSALYLAALSAVRHDARLKAYYDHLTAQGKKKKVALVACMHKMLRILNAMLAKREAYHPQ